MSDASTRLFLCFDSDKDADLRALFTRQSAEQGSMLRIVDWSREAQLTDTEDALRSRIDGVDAVVVLCTERTHDSANVQLEFGMAQAQNKPYVLLSARRSTTCTRPAAARGGDHLYSWSLSILTEQLENAIERKADPLGVERATRLGLRTRGA